MLAMAAKKLGERLRELRTKAGLSQKELAEPEYTNAYVSTIEAGRRRPSQAALECFAGKLGVTAEELATGRSPRIETALQTELQEARRILSEGDYEAAEGLIKKVRREAKAIRLPRLEAKALEALASLHELRGGLHEAVDHYDRALELLKDESPTTWAYATAGKARCYAAEGESHYAIHLIENLRSQLAHQHLEDPEAMGWLLGPLVLAYFDVGMRNEAAQLAGEALQLVPSIPEGRASAALLINIARVHQQREEYSEAVSALTRAEEIYKKLNLKSELAVARVAKGFVLSREGRLQEARSDLEVALNMLEDTGSLANQANAAAELGRVERLVGNPERAEQLLKRSIDLLKEDQDPHVVAWSTRELGLLYARDNPRKAEKHLRAAIKLFSQTSEVMELAHTYRHLGDLLIEQGRTDKGHEAHRQGLLVLERGL